MSEYAEKPAQKAKAKGGVQTTHAKPPKPKAQSSRNAKPEQTKSVPAERSNVAASEAAKAAEPAGVAQTGHVAESEWLTSALEQTGVVGRIPSSETLPGDDSEYWMLAYEQAGDSFESLGRECAAAASNFKDVAEIETQPKPDWKDLLAFAGTVAASAFTGGVAGAVGGLLRRGGAKAAQAGGAAAAQAGPAAQAGGAVVVQALPANAVAPLGLAEQTVHGALVGASKELAGQSLKVRDPACNHPEVSSADARKLALWAFCDHQRRLMAFVGDTAKATFREVARNPAGAKLSIAALKDIRRANTQVANDIYPILYREMIAGWLSLCGPADPIADADLNELSNVGTLGIEVTGRESQPTAVSRAVAKGLGPALRDRLKGTPISQWYGRAAMEVTANGPRMSSQMTGLPIVITTKPNDFQLSDRDREAMVRAGAWGDPGYVAHSQREEQHARDSIAATGFRAAGRKALGGESTAESLAERALLYAATVGDQPQHVESAYRHAAINFGVGRRVDGSLQYISDFGQWFMDDSSSGYVAGRKFLLEVKSLEWLVQAVASLTLPEVEDE